MKKNAKISLAVVLCLVVSMFAGCLTGFAATPDAAKVEKYADVGEGHWAYPWVTFMTENGYVHGYPAEENDGAELYKPEQLITRAEFVTILYYMLNPVTDMTESFDDATADDWYYEFISKAVGEGYLSGYGDGTVKPNAFITREEATSVVYRAFKIDKYTEAAEFADEAEIADWAYEAIMSLAELGIVVGYTGEDEVMSSIQPKVNIKRAEVASLLANADKFYPATVRIDADATVELGDNGGKVSFGMSAKNTSDNLSVAVVVAPEATYTITYTKNGSEATVTPEQFNEVTFTADELKNANIGVNFPNAKKGDKYTVTVNVYDNDIEDEDKLLAGVIYEVEFTENEPVTPTPTPTPSGSLSGGGGSSAIKYTVTFYDMTSGTKTEISTQSVVSGKTATFPDASDLKTYVWYTDEACTAKADLTASITAATSFYAKAERDRVLEALSSYYATKTTGDESTKINANIKADDASKEKDMIKIIVTNDNNALGDGAFDAVLTDTTMMDTYRDVARYAIRNSTAFSDATIATSSKLLYVKYFRAMIKTVDAAADKAIAEYKTALANGSTAQAAFNLFLTAAVVEANSAVDAAMTAEGLPAEYKANIKTTAENYVSALMVAATGKTDEAEQLAALKAMLESKDAASASFASDVKTMIAGYTVTGNVTEE